MSAPKYTPGPWRARRTAGAIKVTVGNPLLGYVDEVCAIDTEENDTADADAALISAAPDMAEVLQELAQDLEHDDDCALLPEASGGFAFMPCDCRRGRALAALKKAGVEL